MPVHRDPELADALAQLALGQEVPEAMWTAVAEVLAWAYGLDREGDLPRIGDEGYGVLRPIQASSVSRAPLVGAPSRHEARHVTQPPPRLARRSALALWQRVQAHR